MHKLTTAIDAIAMMDGVFAATLLVTTTSGEKLELTRSVKEASPWSEHGRGDNEGSPAGLPWATGQ